MINLKLMPYGLERALDDIEPSATRAVETADEAAQFLREALERVEAFPVSGMPDEDSARTIVVVMEVKVP